MTAFDIYSAIGEISEELLEKSEMSSRPKISMIPMAALAACLAVFAAGLHFVLRDNDIIIAPEDIGISSVATDSAPDFTEVSSDTSETYIEPYESLSLPDTESSVTETSSQSDRQMPPPFLIRPDSGGDQNAGFYEPCTMMFGSIPGSLIDLRNMDDVYEWIDSYPRVWSHTPSSITEYMNRYSFISDFNITRTEAEQALEFYINDGQITHDQLDILFSGNIALITKTFATEYSIVIGEKIYSPHWLYVHSPEEYEAAGITADMILERVGLYSYFDLTDEARAAFSDKLSAYTGETIFIEPMQYTEKEDDYIVTAVPEDVGVDVYDSEIEIPADIEEDYIVSPAAR